MFLTRKDGDGPRDGDPHAEAEALIAALSAGPVGIGDRVGRTVREIAMRTCRADGALVKPDAPLAALDRCFHAHPVLAHVPLVAATHTQHAAGRWTYVASLHASNEKQPMSFRVALGELGEDAPVSAVIAWDWRSRTLEQLAPTAGFELSLRPLEWNYRVLAPILPGEIAVIGDASLYACAGRERLAGVRATGAGVVFDAIGAPGERVVITGWAARRPAGATACGVGTTTPIEVEWDAATGCFEVAIEIPDTGFLRVEVACASS